MSSINPPRPQDEWVMPPETAPDATAASAPARPARLPASARRAATAVALTLAGMLVGGGVVLAVDDHASATGSPGDQPAAVGGPQGFDGGVAGPGGPGAAGGPIAGEQHIQGTVGAKTATTVTVESSGGSATYTVDAATQIIRNGQSATLAAVQVGDPVLVHVYPSSSGQMLVERLFAGGSGGFGRPGSDSPDSEAGEAGSPSGGLTT